MNLAQGGVVHVQIAIRESDDVAILDLQGKSTTRGDSELLNRHIRKVRAKGVQKVLLNLADLTQIDSSGVSIIARTYVSLRDQGGDLKLLRPGGHVLDVFKPLHLLDIIPSFEDETQALASFRPVQRQNYEHQH
jgi:anti-anti-sigma factor